MGSVGELCTSMLSNCSEMLLFWAQFWKTCYFIVSKQTCTMLLPKWTKACDKRPEARLISYIHHTCEYHTALLCG